MKILILGSEGFIGGHCVNHFLNAGYDVSGADLFERPSRPYTYIKVSRLSPELDELFSAENFEAVINAAGSAHVPYSMAHPVIDFEANCLDTIRTLDAIRKHQPTCKYIHLSSAAVYGNPAKLPVSESDALMPLSPYGWHKLMSEQICREFSSIYGLPLAIVRPFSVYGPGLKKQLFWDLFQKMSDNAGAFELHGSGNESRDYIHVSDLIRAIACILDKGEVRGETYNLASGVETTIAEAVRIFKEAVGIPCTYTFNGIVREGDPFNWCADTKKIKALGFAPTYQLRDGLQSVASWLKALK